MDAGVSPSVRLADGGAEAAVRPGKLSVINVLPESRVIHPLFGGHEPLPGLTTVDRSTFGIVAGATGALPVVTSPVDGGTRIFLGGANKTLYDYNLRTREVRAVVEADEPFNFSGVASSDMVCMASGQLSQSTRGNAGGALIASFMFGLGSVQISEIDGSGVLMGINRRTGNLDWTVPGDFMGAPVLGQGQVFVGGLGTLACFDLATGTQVWKVRPKYKGGDREWFSPGVPDGGTLISLVVPVRVQGGLLGRGKFRLAAFDAATGAEKWKKDLFEIQDHRAPLSNSVVVRPAEGRVLVVLGDRISAHSLANGSELWKFTTRQDPKTNDADKLGKFFSREIAVADGMVYAGCEDKNLYGLSEKDGSLVWKVPTRGEVGIPTVSNGTVLVGSKDKYLYALDGGTGTLQWKYHCGTRVAGRPLVKGNFVYCGTEGGSLLDIRMPQR